MKLLFILIFITFNSYGALIGKDAPDFSLKNQDGKITKLMDAKGKYVVLEWLNHGCPFVKKHYKSGNMQKVQKQVTKDKVVWYSIISSAEGKQGFSSEKKAKEDAKIHGSNADAILLDTTGEVGKSYGAKTTPHMFIIAPDGKIIYEGAIDSIASADPSDIDKATNFITQTLNSALKGERIKNQKTRPYGCSVKY